MIPLAALPKLLPGNPNDAAYERYLAMCNEYLKRQILVYQNWPQRKFGPLGYSEEKVFGDLNA